MPESSTNELLLEVQFLDEHLKTVFHSLPYYPYTHVDIARKGVNMTLLWEEYCTECNTEGTMPCMDT